MRSSLVLVAVALCVACIPESETTAPKVAAAPASDGGAQPVIDADVAADPKKLLETVDALRDQLKGRPRDFQVNTALGNLFYDNGRYIEAIEYFSDALTIAAHAEKVALSIRTGGLPADGDASDSCRFDGEKKGQTFEYAQSVSQELLGKDPASGRACFVALGRTAAGLRARRGNSWYLVGNPEKAKADHAVALTLEPAHPEALFFMGALTFELARGDEAELEKGRGYWQKLLEVAPDHPRADLVKQTLPRVHELFGRRGDAMAAHPPMGGQQPAPGPGAAPPALPPGMAEAAQGMQRTPEMDAALDKTLDAGDRLLAEKKWQEALDTFKSVMPVRPDGRVMLGMGVALREIGKPTAQMVLTQATRFPGAHQPRAKLELAILYEKSDAAQAKALLVEVKDDPIVGAQAKSRLAALE